MILKFEALYQTAYTIKTNCDNLVNSLCLKYGKYISKAIHEYGIVISAIKNNDEYLIDYNDKKYRTNYPLYEIDNIIFENTSYDDNIFALHGTAVGYKGQAYLFLAPTTSGKTTLASYLTSNGFGYITDDCILLDRNCFYVHPYTTPIHLRDGGLEVLKKYNCVPNNLKYLDDMIIKRYIYIPQNCIVQAIPLAKIFFITRTENENNLFEMSVTERMIELMKAPITDYIITSEYIKFISILAQRDCYRLHYSDMQYVVEVIQNE